MSNQILPSSGLILAGFFAELALSKIISIVDGSWVCKNDGVPWFLLIALSAGVAILTACKSEGNRTAQGVLAFVGSFILNVSGNNLGYLALSCSELLSSKNYTYFTTPVMASASLVIVVNFLSKETEAHTSGDSVPDPDVILLGVCFQYTVWNCANVISDGADFLCERGGLGSWLELLLVSCILTIFNYVKTGASGSMLLVTFLGSLIIHLTLGGVGWWAMFCATSGDLIKSNHSKTYGYITLVIHCSAALVLTVVFMKKEDTTEYHEPTDNNLLRNHPYTPSYSSQETYPSQACYPPQSSFTPQESKLENFNRESPASSS